METNCTPWGRIVNL